MSVFGVAGKSRGSRFQPPTKSAARRGGGGLQLGTSGRERGLNLGAEGGLKGHNLKLRREPIRPRHFFQT